MSIKFVKAENVYDDNGDFLGKIEAYEGDENAFEAVFIANEDAVFNSDDLRDVADRLKYNHAPLSE